MPLPALIVEHREEILRLATRRGARRIRVFGSVVRGEDDPESDVDFLVEMAPDRSLLDRGGLLMDLQELLGREVDVVAEGNLREEIRERVLGEAQSL